MLSEQELSDAIKQKVSEVNSLLSQGYKIGMLADITISTDWSEDNTIGLKVEMFKKTVF